MDIGIDIDVDMDRDSDMATSINSGSFKKRFRALLKRFGVDMRRASSRSL